MTAKKKSQSTVSPSPILSKQWLSKQLVPEKLFLLIGLVFGLTFVFVFPPMQSPDEQTHFYKAYQTAEFNLFPDRFTENGVVRYGAQLPKSVYDESRIFLEPVAGKPTITFNTSLYRDRLDTPLEKSKTKMVGNEAGNVYSPVVYTPQAAGIKLGSLLNASPLILIWLGRIANLMVWLTLGYLALRLIPFAKWGLFVLLLNPVAVSLSASLSGDVMSIGLAFVFVSFVFWLAARKIPATTKEIAALSCLGVGLVLTKPTNILLLPALLLIPAKVFGKPARKYLVGGAIVLVAVALGLLWNVGNKELLETAVQLQRPGAGVDPTRQLHYIFSNPLTYVWTIVTNFILVFAGSSADAVLSTYVGIFGWLDTSIPLWTQITYLVTLCIAMLFQFGRGFVFSSFHKLFLIAIFAAMFVASVTAMYLNWTPVGARIFEGVQGRYFMPASILLLGVFTGKKKLIDNYDKQVQIGIVLMICLVLGVSLLKIFARYY